MAQQDHLFALPQGYEIAGYRFGKVLGSGGYGITYRGEEPALGRTVAIKEYLPNHFARRAQDGVTVKPRDAKQQELFNWGIERFRQEAETLVQLKHPNIVRVLRFFPSNGTAYLVMIYEEGVSLGDRLREGATLRERELRALLDPLLSGLEVVHDAGYLHRDIKPDNIYLRGDGSPVLLDFGSARQAIGVRTQSITSIVSPGYSPFEQYGKSIGDQGPWTDLYALGATLYRCITGKRPPTALDRIAAKGGMPSAADAGRGLYDPALLRAIDAALAVRAEERPQNIAGFRAVMRGSEPDKRSGRGERVVAELGSTLVAGQPRAPAGAPVPAEPGATLVSGVGAAPPQIPRRTEPAPRPKPPAAPAGKFPPALLAVAAGVIFAAAIGLVVLIAVLLSGGRR